MGGLSKVEIGLLPRPRDVPTKSLFVRLDDHVYDALIGIKQYEGVPMSDIIDNVVEDFCIAYYEERRKHTVTKPIQTTLDPAVA